MTVALLGSTPFFHVRTRNSSYSWAVRCIMNHEAPLLMSFYLEVQRNVWYKIRF